MLGRQDKYCVPFPSWLAEFDAPCLLAVDAAKLSANLLRARRGAAAGPSGATCEHLRARRWRLLRSLAQCGTAFGLCKCACSDCGRAPPWPALQKHAGGIRALVMGDVFRRLVSRTLAQLGAQLQEACAPLPIRLDHEGGYGSIGTRAPLRYGVPSVHNNG